MSTLHTPQQNRSLAFTPNPSASHDPTSLFNAIGSGALASLHTLIIRRPYRAENAPAVVIGDAKLLPNSLPPRKLEIDANMSAGLVGAIFAAAGPGLPDMGILYGGTVKAAMRLLEENDYAWAPTLRSLKLGWKREYWDYSAQPLDPDLHALDALARLPALKSLALDPGEPDELVVRLLAVAEGGGLQSLDTLEIDKYGWHPSEGGVLLLLLWLKREAKKALRGEGEGALWDVRGLLRRDMNPSLKQITETHLAQLKEARTQIRKARAVGAVVV